MRDWEQLKKRRYRKNLTLLKQVKVSLELLLAGYFFPSNPTAVLWRKPGAPRWVGVSVLALVFLGGPDTIAGRG